MDNNKDNISSDSIKQFYINLLKANFTINEGIMKYYENNFSKRSNADINLDPLNLYGSFAHAYSEFWSDPKSVVDAHINLVKDYINIFDNVIKRSSGEGVPTLYNTNPRDKRFQDEAWEKNPMFNFIKQAYSLNSVWLTNIVNHLNTLSPKESQKINFYTKLLIDAMSPTNFPAMNPEVINKSMSSNGESLVKGAEHLYNDLVNSKNGFHITTADLRAFKIGDTIAATPGAVVYQNDLMQLIQYNPTTSKVYEAPLLIIPAWINKFYILDLQSTNSYVKWLVSQGYTVYMLSWVNPDKSHKDKSFYDYMNDGIIRAIEQINKLSKTTKINLIGYCLGGTLLACTIAYIKAKKIKSFEVQSLTFLTTLVDFEDAGDLGVFIDDEQLNMLEKRMNVKGYLEGSDMSQTFSMIRANDMIWSYYVNNYMLGKEIVPFDILYWNSDSTRLPAKVHSFYLRNMYQNNLLAKQGEMKLGDVNIDLKKNDLPTYILATRQDHIVPWKSAYKATKLYGGKMRFVLSASGHVAGVTNHPDSNKYSYWINDNIKTDANTWFDNSQENSGSWWIDWDKWQSKLSGEKIPARKVDPKTIIEKAPGSYLVSKLD